MYINRMFVVVSLYLWYCINLLFVIHKHVDLHLLDPRFCRGYHLIMNSEYGTIESILIRKIQNFIAVVDVCSCASVASSYQLIWGLEVYLIPIHCKNVLLILFFIITDTYHCKILELHSRAIFIYMLLGQLNIILKMSCDFHFWGIYNVTERHKRDLQLLINRTVIIFKQMKLNMNVLIVIIVLSFIQVFHFKFCCRILQILHHWTTKEYWPWQIWNTRSKKP